MSSAAPAVMSGTVTRGEYLAKAAEPTGSELDAKRQAWAAEQAAKTRDPADWPSANGDTGTDTDTAAAAAAAEAAAEAAERLARYGPCPVCGAPKKRRAHVTCGDAACVAERKRAANLARAKPAKQKPDVAEPEMPADIADALDALAAALADLAAAVAADVADRAAEQTAAEARLAAVRAALEA